MARQYLSAKNVKKLVSMTGRPYQVALVRGNWHDKDGRWCEAHLAATGMAANIDSVNRDTGEWSPKVRDGIFVGAR